MLGVVRQMGTGLVGILFVCLFSYSLTVGQGSPPLNIDHDGNGVIDTKLLDTDENGLYDGAQLDVDEDGRFDVQLAVVDGVPSIRPPSIQLKMLDINGDGLPEQVKIDLDGDGISELALNDQDGYYADGTVDKICINTDEDGVWSIYKATGELESVKAYLVVCMPEKDRTRFSELYGQISKASQEVEKALAQRPTPDFDTAIKALRSMIEWGREILVQFDQYPEVVSVFRTIVYLEDEALDMLERAADLYHKGQYNESLNLWRSFWNFFNRARPLYHYIQICRAEAPVQPPRFVVFVTAEKLYATGAGAQVPHFRKGIDRFLLSPETPEQQPYGLVLSDVSDWVTYHVIITRSITRIRLCLANPHVPPEGTRVSVYVHSDPVTPPDNVKPPCHDVDPATPLGCAGQPRWEKLGTVIVQSPGEWRIYSIRLDMPLRPGGYLITIRLDEPPEEIREGSNEIWIAWLQLVEH